MLADLKMITGEFYSLVVTFMIIIIMTLLISIYVAVRVDRLWSLIKRQHDVEELKKEVKADLKIP
jgi:hypothetical protein